jgi:hypothetical protein
MRTPASISGILILSATMLAMGCDDDDDGDLGVGGACSSATECYLGLDEEVMGEAVCLDRVERGYCTHECDSDADCCAVEGECPNGKEQVCGPFESTGLRLCFLSCEGQDDGDAFCGEFAHVGFICRSTGGGSENRKVCVPND